MDRSGTHPHPPRSFPCVAPAGKVIPDMLVDFAPYLFRGKLGGFLTRLSATGLANVTSGGGQVPAFRVSPKSRTAQKLGAATPPGFLPSLLDLPAAFSFPTQLFLWYDAHYAQSPDVRSRCFLAATGLFRTGA